MARSKFTANKATGAPAPRIALASMPRHSGNHSSASVPSPTPSQKPRHNAAADSGDESADEVSQTLLTPSRYGAN